jgi:hypothetical protein
MTILLITHTEIARKGGGHLSEGHMEAAHRGGGCPGKGPKEVVLLLGAEAALLPGAYACNSATPQRVEIRWQCKEIRWQ